MAKNIEAKLLEALDTVHDMGQAKAAPMDILRFVIETAERLQAGAIAGITFLDPDRKNFTGGCFPTIDPAFADGLRGASTAPPFVGSCAMSVATGETVTSLDIKNDSRFMKPWRDHCLNHGLASLESRPVMDGPAAIGTFVLAFQSPGGAMVIDERVLRFAAQSCAAPLRALRREAPSHSPIARAAPQTCTMQSH